MMDSMPSESKQLAERIDRPATEVYEYVSNPANIPRWAPGLGCAVEDVDGQWFVDTPAGRAAVTFAQRNDFGVLDHYVTTPSSGEVVYIPMRVTADGTGSEVVFTLRRLPGMTDEEFARDEDLVTADLARLKRILEGAA
jgi:uncharacterized protein YndB with AHSA1/START domain